MDFNIFKGFISKVAMSLKKGTEFLGKHPFATGLLALLSILGFIFSIVAYKVDRKESSETEKQIEATSDHIIEAVVDKSTYDRIDYSIVFTSETKLEHPKKTNRYNYSNQFFSMMLGMSGSPICIEDDKELSIFKKTEELIGFIEKNHGKVVYLTFNWDDRECSFFGAIAEITKSSKPYKGKLMVSSLNNFRNNVSYKLSYNINKDYVQASIDSDFAYILAYEKEYKGGSHLDEFYIVVWPPLRELSTHIDNSSEYHVQFEGAYKAKIAGYGGGTALYLIPTETVDYAKYERTLRLGHDSHKNN